MKFDKITSRINKLCYGLDNRFVDSAKISQKVSCAGTVSRSCLDFASSNDTSCFLNDWTHIVEIHASFDRYFIQVIQGVYPGVTTIELDELAAQTSAYMATQHPDFSKLAARISVSNLHKQTNKVVTRAKIFLVLSDSWDVAMRGVIRIYRRNHVYMELNVYLLRLDPPSPPVFPSLTGVQ